MKMLLLLIMEMTNTYSTSKKSAKIFEQKTSLYNIFQIFFIEMRTKNQTPCPHFFCLLILQH